MGRGYHLSNDSFEFSPANGNHVQKEWDDELEEEDVWGKEETSDSCDHAYFEQTETNWVQADNGASSKSSNGTKSSLSMELQVAGVLEKSKERSDVGFALIGNGESKDGGWAPGFLARKVKIPQFSNGGGGGGSKYGSGWYDHCHYHQDAAINGGGVPQSAPVLVPVWPSKQAAAADGGESEEDGDCNGEDEDGEDENGDHEEEYDNDDDNDEGAGKRRRERLAPHQIVDREDARSQKTRLSVTEGAGRTLKGMDLRRVRNAVWSRIGFED